MMLASLLPPEVRVNVVDVGANPIDDTPPYMSLLKAGRAHVTGFEPNLTAFERLTSKASANERYLPHAVGDGKPVEFRLCRAPGMSSTLPLNVPLMKHFHKFVEWGQVVTSTPMNTVRLDDLTDIPDIDFLKIDVQGGELAVFEGARNKLSRALYVHTEVMFQDMYVGQPLFADQDAFLRGLGFRLHAIVSPMVRCLAPVMLGQDPYSGINQLLQADAVYVRDFARFESLSPEQLMAVALVAHDVYQSADLAHLALSTHDVMKGTSWASRYLVAVTQPTATNK